ncbi:MAG: LTA synthase family protein [Actinomycetaceae bacterium]|nr:LTA synthase family protein [Actinomycetaceae bacterium]
MISYLNIFQVALVLLCAIGWAVGQRNRVAAAYGIVHGVFISSLSLALVGITLPAAGEDHLVTTEAFLKLYLLWVVVIALVSTLWIGWATDRGHFARSERTRPTWRIVLTSLLYGLVGLLTAAIFYLSNWVASTFANVQADQLLFFLLGGSPGTTPEQAADLTLRVTLPTIGLTAAFLVLPVLLTGATKRPENQDVPATFLSIPTLPRRRVRRLTSGVVATCLLASIVFSFTALPIYGAARAYFVRSNFIAENYVAPSAQILKFPDKPKNFIHIYLESMENSYYSQEQGGYLEQDLMPELAKLTDENTTFSHTDKYGGPRQTYGANHSLAGMMNFQAGVPMIPYFNSTVGGRISYADFTTIGDILHEQGYANSFMLGTWAGWYDMGDYFRKHGDFQIFDLQTARERKLVPSDYMVWWGIEDDKLYEYAKDEMTRLGEGNQPFYFILENADTHPNGGYVSPRMTQTPSSKQYGNVIHYSQGEVVELVRWIQAQPWYKDTVIVVTGDHKSMDNEFFVGWDPSYERTVVNMIVNAAVPDPGRGRTHQRDFAPFDFFPTILASLGVKIEGDRLGLGTNLYSDKPTLLEEHGFEYVDRELRKRSDFYEQHRDDDPNRNLK